VKNEDRWNKSDIKNSRDKSKFVGRGVALLDPKVMDDLHLSTGDVIGLSGKKKSCFIMVQPAV
jgi:hypothetical protein